MLTLSSTTVSYKSPLNTNLDALKKISVQINKGEKVGIIGPSGAGKSTLLTELYHIACKENVCEPSVIHQDFALVEQLSVFHNVYMGQLDNYSFITNLRNFFLPSEDKKVLVNAVLTPLHLQNKLHAKVSALSGGQKQRVAIARCLYRNTDLILADEPVSSIDPLQAESILNLLFQSAETVVVSLHSTDMALRLCDRLLALNDGQLLFDGNPNNLSDEQLKHLFHQ